jgi:hypothetical protein
MREPYQTGPKSAAIETLTRRASLVGGGSVAVLAALWWMRDGRADAATFEIVKSDDEWRRLLKPAAYNVLRHHGTERPFTSPLNAEKRQGVFACAGCDLPLFASETKFESGTGWPSFTKPLRIDVIGTHRKNRRIEPLGLRNPSLMMQLQRLMDGARNVEGLALRQRHGRHGGLRP